MKDALVDLLSRDFLKHRPGAAALLGANAGGRTVLVPHAGPPRALRPAPPGSGGTRAGARLPHCSERPSAPVCAKRINDPPHPAGVGVAPREVYVQASPTLGLSDFCEHTQHGARALAAVPTPSTVSRVDARYWLFRLEHVSTRPIPQSRTYPILRARDGCGVERGPRCGPRELPR